MIDAANKQAVEPFRRSEAHWRLSPSPEIAGQARLPGDKSISHRALLFSALAEAPTALHNLGDGLDVRATAAALAAMGVSIVETDGVSQVNGVGLSGLQASSAPLDMGNSGTAMRLLSGVLAGQGFRSTLIGDESLSSRPMRRIQQPLQRMGANISLSEDGTAPIRIEPAEALAPIDYEMPVASAQIQSCVLLAALYTSGRSCVSAPLACRDHSVRALRLFGRSVRSANDGRRVCIDNSRGQALASPGRIDVPGDLSSAAFFIVAALLARQGRVCLPGVGLNPTRDGVIRVLGRMGAQIEVQGRRKSGEEEIADLVIEPAPLSAVSLDADDVSLAIDEIPVLAVACAAAAGTSRIRGARELRVKESDRIAATARLLATLGITHRCYDDGLDIEGAKDFTGGEIDAGGDHRIAMAAAVAAARARQSIIVRDIDNVATSFPAFADLARRLGLEIDLVAG